MSNIVKETWSAQSQRSERSSDWVEEDDDFPLPSRIEPAPRVSENNSRYFWTAAKSVRSKIL